MWVGSSWHLELAPPRALGPAHPAEPCSRPPSRSARTQRPADSECGWGPETRGRKSPSSRRPLRRAPPVTHAPSTGHAMLAFKSHASPTRGRHTRGPLCRGGNGGTEVCVRSRGSVGSDLQVPRRAQDRAGSHPGGRLCQAGEQPPPGQSLRPTLALATPRSNKGSAVETKGGRIREAGREKD